MSNPDELFTPFLGSVFSLPSEKDRFGVFILDSFNDFVDSINDRKIGTITDAAENFNGEVWTYSTSRVIRNGYQTFAYIPSLPNAGVLTIDTNNPTTYPTYPIKGVNPELTVTFTYGSASKPCTAIGAGDGDYFSFMSKGDPRISYTLSDTNIVITTTVDLTAYSCYIVINYLRNGT